MDCVHLHQSFYQCGFLDIIIIKKDWVKKQQSIVKNVLKKKQKCLYYIMWRYDHKDCKIILCRVKTPCSIATFLLFSQTSTPREDKSNTQVFVTILTPLSDEI